MLAAAPWRSPRTPGRWRCCARGCRHRLTSSADLAKEPRQGRHKQECPERSQAARRQHRWQLAIARSHPRRPARRTESAIAGVPRKTSAMRLRLALCAPGQGCGHAWRSGCRCTTRNVERLSACCCHRICRGVSCLSFRCVLAFDMSGVPAVEAYDRIPVFCGNARDTAWLDVIGCPTELRIGSIAEGCRRLLRPRCVARHTAAGPPCMGWPRQGSDAMPRLWG